MLIDTHVHFDGFPLGDVDGIICRAVSAGVEKMIAVGGAAEGNTFAVDLARRFPGKITAAAGFDREHAGQISDLAGFESFAREGKVNAVGEIGLDYHYHPETADAQKELLRCLLQSARNLLLPVIVHSRNADDDTVGLLKEHVALWKGDPARIGVIHCFTGDSAFARRVLECGFCVSFSGIVTFTKAMDLREVVKIVPDDRLLIETDSPYLAPEPHRGKTNEPAYVRHVAEVLALVRGCSVETIAKITTANAVRLFGL